jgi:hypothetical protein
VQTFNKRRAGYRRAEAVVSVLVTEEPFSSANGLLGNTLKLKRAAVLRRYTELLDDKVGGVPALAPLGFSWVV